MSALYDFSGSGLGTFTFDPVSTFQVIGLNDAVETTPGATPIDIANAGSITITITDDASKRELELDKLVMVLPIECGDHSELVSINSSVTEARALASLASSYIRIMNDGDQPFKDYFGTNSKKDVMEEFDRIFNVDTFNAHSHPNQITLSCFYSSDACDRNKFAYADGLTIHYCLPFNEQRGVEHIQEFCVDTSDHAYRGGTTLRMLAAAPSDFIVDLQQGCDAVKRLGDTKKLGSAENYEVSIQTPGGLPRARC